jgi:phosphoribosylamine--glycine ligase
MQAAANGSLSNLTLPTKTRHCAVCVVLATDGYPDAYRKTISLKIVADTDITLTFHAGTKNVNGVLMNTGGRVLNAVGLGPTLQDARKKAYELAEQLRVPGLRFRSDIADAVDS